MKETQWWTIVDENISFTSTILGRIRKSEWYHPFFKKTYGWEYLSTDEDWDGNEVVCGMKLNEDREEIPVADFIKIIEENKDQLWENWSRVEMVD